MACVRHVELKRRRRTAAAGALPYLDSTLHRLQKSDRFRIPDVRHLVRLGRPDSIEDQRKLFLEVLWCDEAGQVKRSGREKYQRKRRRVG